MRSWFLLVFLSLSFSSYSSTYTAKITQIQGEGIGDAYNTLYLAFDIKDSPCSSSNSINRLTILNNVQQSIALTALVSNKEVTVQTNGLCKGEIEGINYIIIKANS